MSNSIQEENIANKIMDSSLDTQINEQEDDLGEKNQHSPTSSSSVVSSHSDNNNDVVGIKAEDKNQEYSDSDENLVREFSHSPANIGPDNESNVDDVERLSRSLTNMGSIAESAKKYTAPLPSMGGGRPYPPSLPKKDQFTVTFEGEDDPLHPFNWSFKKKAAIFFALSTSVITIAFGSSIYSTAIEALAIQYGVSTEVTTLGVTFYVLGFALGPIAWAPLSELYGRKIIILISIFIFTCFSFATATAKDLQTILICRFFAGCIGSAPIAVVGAAFADMFDNEQRGYAMSAFSLGVVLGPQIAPIIGGFVTNSYLGWRWTEYLTGILGAVSTVLVLFIYEESHYPIILVSKAEELRRRTGNWGIRAAHEEFNLSFREIVEKNISRPLVLLFTEPIIFLVTLYVAFVYGVLYLCLTAIPIIFAGKYGWTGGIVYLPYIAMIIGQMAGCLWTMYCEGDYIKAVKANNGKPVPEARLPAMRIPAVIFPIGLLWLCWTGNYPEQVPWPAPACSGIFIGFGLMGIFLPSLNYIIDCYLIYAASALAANCLIRSIFGAVFPLFGTYMFNGMGVNWAGLLLGLFALLMTPIPFLFIIYGKRIRQRSKYAFDLQEN